MLTLKLCAGGFLGLSRCLLIPEVLAQAADFIENSQNYVHGSNLLPFALLPRFQHIFIFFSNALLQASVEFFDSLFFIFVLLSVDGM
jgi:hypothetical protein